MDSPPPPPKYEARLELSFKQKACLQNAENRQCVHQSNEGKMLVMNKKVTVLQ